MSLVRERSQRTEIPDLTDEQLARAISGLKQAEFARAIAISIHTLRNGEQGRRKPEGR